MSNTPFARVIAAIATPFRSDFGIDFARLGAHARWLLDNGCDGLVLFGTTGEAASLTIEERKLALEMLVAAGIGAEKIVVGTGCCAIADTVELTKHAGSVRVAGALILPPYFYKGISDAGIGRTYDHIFAACGALLPPVYLYHIPQVAGAGVGPDLLGRLIDRHGGAIRGYKDSSGKWDNTRTVLARYPGIDVYVGSETLLVETLRAGGAGCISASVNVQPAAVRAMVESWRSGQADIGQTRATAIRQMLEKSGPLIPAVKAVLGRIHDHDGWAFVRPPLEPLPRLACESLFAELRTLGLKGV